MYKKTKYIEATVNSATQQIHNFFGDDTVSRAAFCELCSYMLSIDEGFIIRESENIIGICRAGEFYRFYILKQAEGYCIKFKHYTDSVPFDPVATDLFLADCDTVNAYFEKNIERLILKSERRRSKTLKAAAAVQSEEKPATCVAPERKKRRKFPYNVNAWMPVRQKVAAALKTELSYAYTFTDTSRRVYAEFIGILCDLCLDLEIMSKIKGDVVKKRVINYREASLQELGEKYGVTREWIRQLEVKGWGIAERLLSKYDTPYTERVIDLFLQLSDCELIGAIAYIGYKNAFLGEWLSRTVADSENRSAFDIALKNMR